MHRCNVSHVGFQSAGEYPVQPIPTALDSCQIRQLPVAVSGQDLTGIVFVDECSTTAIAPNGAIVTVNRPLGAGQVVFLRYGIRERLAQVIGHSAGGNYGLCFLRSEPEFWDTALHRDEIDEGPLEDPATEPHIAPDPLLVPHCDQFEQPIAPKPAAARAERRRSRRITMRKAKACVEIPERESEIVELVDISRDGICFRSHCIYPVGVAIRVAAPYTEGSTNLFVSARIVRVQRDSWGGFYGVEYSR